MPIRKRTMRKKQAPMKKLRHDVSLLKKEMKAEERQIDQNLGWTSSNTMVINHLTPVAQGDDRNNRQGNTINLKTLEIKYTQVSGSATPCTHRLIYLQYRSGLLNSPPAAGNVLQTATSVISPYAADTKKNFKILKDVTIVSPGTGQEGTIKAGRFFIPLKGLATYTGTTGALYDKNQIFCCSVTTSTDMVYSQWSRVTYNE